MKNNESITEWLNASLYLAYCDGDFAEMEEKMIMSIMRRWTGGSHSEVIATYEQAKSEFHHLVRKASRSNQLLVDLVFPTGIVCRDIPIKKFLTSLVAIKLADDIVDYRERDALLDIIALMPSKRIPALVNLRTEAFDLLRIHRILLGRNQSS